MKGFVFTPIICCYSLKGIWQVSKATYESCDITDEPIRVWSPPQMGGETVVWLDSGQTSYFIDSVAGNCIDGSKLMVCMYVHITFKICMCISVLDHIRTLCTYLCR